LAERKPLVINAGQIQQIQTGDTLDVNLTGEVDTVSLENENAGTIVIGCPVYCSDVDKVDKAQANAVATVEVLGLVQDVTILTTASGNIQTDGVLTATTGQWDAITGDTGGLTAGSVYYLDPDTAGMLTTTVPPDAGDFVLRVGKAISATGLEISILNAVKL